MTNRSQSFEAVDFSIAKICLTASAFTLPVIAMLHALAFGRVNCAVKRYDLQRFF